MGHLGRQLMEPQRREQAHHGTRMFTRNLREGSVLGHFAARQRIESSTNPREPPLADQPGQRDPGQPVGLQVYRTEQTFGSRQVKDGVLRARHGARMFPMRFGCQ